MAPKAVKRVLKPGTSSIFIGKRDRVAAAVAWRLDVRDDAAGRARSFSKRHGPGGDRGRYKLFHYISAGGMRQLRRTSADDWAEARRRSFSLFLGALAVLWLFFYFLPSA